MPTLFIIAGPNGAGKTSYARRFLPEEMRFEEFVNADLIAAGLSPFAHAKPELPAGRIMLQRIRELAARRKNFAFETTLSGRSYAAFLKEMRAAGYRIRLDFLWIPSLDIARERVLQRVKKGGHDIPGELQQRRFLLGLRNLAGLYRPLIHHWRILDNTGRTPRLIAEKEDGLFTVADAPLLARIEQMANVRFMEEEGKAGRVEESISPPAQSEDTRKALRALRKAFADTVLENLRFGLPVIQYLDGKVVAVPAKELEPLARRILATNGEPGL